MKGNTFSIFVNGQFVLEKKLTYFIESGRPGFFVGTATSAAFRRVRVRPYSMQLQRWGCFPGGDVPHHRKRRQGGQSAHDPDRHQTPAGHWNNAAANAVGPSSPCT